MRIPVRRRFFQQTRTYFRDNACECPKTSLPFQRFSVSSAEIQGSLDIACKGKCRENCGPHGVVAAVASPRFQRAIPIGGTGFSEVTRRADRCRSKQPKQNSKNMTQHRLMISMIAVSLAFLAPAVPASTPNEESIVLQCSGEARSRLLAFSQSELEVEER